MADDEHLGILKQGVAAWNKWRASNPEIRPNLTDAFLLRANLPGADLQHADLMDANLTGADLTRANLSGAILTGAELTDAKLVLANLTNADLRGADNLTRGQLNSACIVKASNPPTLPKGLKPPQRNCMLVPIIL